MYKVHVNLSKYLAKTMRRISNFSQEKHLLAEDRTKISDMELVRVGFKLR